MGGAEVGEVVAVDRSQDDIPQLLDITHLGNPLRFQGVKPAIGIAGFDRTKATAPGADIAH
jgi:hypothetical protein